MHCASTCSLQFIWFVFSSPLSKMLEMFHVGRSLILPSSYNNYTRFLRLLQRKLRRALVYSQPADQFWRGHDDDNVLSRWSFPSINMVHIVHEQQYVDGNNIRVLYVLYLKWCSLGSNWPNMHEQKMTRTNTTNLHCACCINQTQSSVCHDRNVKLTGDNPAWSAAVGHLFYFSVAGPLIWN